MTIHKSMTYFNKKAKIDKAFHQKTAHKIQLYNNKLVDNFVEDFNKSGVSSKPATSMLMAELSILNKPEVYKNYNRIVNSPYTSNSNLNNMLIKNKANKDLDNVVKGELERISKNLNYVEQVLNKYNIPTKEYQKLLNEQANKSVANRQQLLKEVAVQNGEILKSEGFNIPSNVFTYKDIETTAQSMLRQSQMTAGYEEKLQINQEYLDNGKDAIYTHKQWIHTGAGATTRHESNHMQKVRFDEPFIVVNDVTLDIDEMDYPCDPAGSFSNAYICYCEVDYLMGEDDPYSETLDYMNGSIDIANPDLFKETPVANETPSVTFLPNIKGLFDTAPNGEFIDVNGLEKVNANIGEGYTLSTNEGAVYNEADGNLYYKGLKAVKHQYDADIDYGIGFFKEADIIKHNAQFGEVKTNVENSEILAEPVENKPLTNEIVNADAEIIDLSLFNENGKYAVDQFVDNVKYNEVTGHWEYKGLWVKDYDADIDIGTIYLEEAKAHNDKINGNKPSAKPVIEKEVIDIDKLPYVEETNEYLVLKDKLNYDETTGKYDYKGLDVTDNLGITGSAYIPTEKIINHNMDLGASTFNKPVNAEVLEPKTETVEEIKSDNKQYIDTSILEELTEHSWYIDGIGDANIKKDLKFNSDAGYWEYKGLKVNGTSETTQTGWIEKIDVENHNKSLGFKPAGEYINIDGVTIEGVGSKYYIHDKANIKLNTETGKYEYKGLQLDSFNGTFGKVKKKALEEHNKKYSENETNKQNEYIDFEDFTYVGGDKYIIDESLLTEINGEYYYKDLKVTLVSEFGYGKTTEADIIEHNKNSGSGEVTLNNKYINKMDNHLTPIRENGEIYIQDNKTGKKYLYDEKQIYERKQDVEQGKVDYGQYETDSTKHWGRYGHQIINGLIYGIEKYGYDAYTPYFNEAKPILNELRSLHKKVYENENLKVLEIDVDGKPIYAETKRIDKLMDDLGEIVDNIPEKRECTASLTEIKNAFWEIVYMDKAIIETPELLQDTFLVRFGHFGEELCEIGKTVNLEGFTSTTYESGSASHFEDKMADNPNRWAILIMADEGTKGVRLNNQFDALTTEREWLLTREQDYEVVGFDKSTRTVILKVLKNKNY